MKWLPCLSLLCLAACGSTARLPQRSTLAPAALHAPQNYLVITIRNPLSLPSSRAASTARGYNNAAVYQAGSFARAVALRLSRQYDLVEAASWPIAVLGVHCLVYQLPAGATSEAAIARLAHDPQVESVQPLLEFDTAARPYNDPYASLQRNLQAMDVEAAQTVSRGAGVKVAVIDTGVELSHPDLPSKIAARNFVDNDSAIFNDDAHGTAIAGVIAAVPDNGVGIVGIAPDVTLLAYKACWRTEAGGVQAVCNTFTIAQAIAAAIDSHADIINMSLAGPSDPLLTRLLRQAMDANIIVVGAVSPQGAAQSFPASVSGVVAVDVAEHTGGVSGTLRAPGRDVLSLAPAGHYDYYSGSSLATAEITGIIALMRSARPHLSARQAAQLLASSSAPVPDANVALQALLRNSGS